MFAIVIDPKIMRWMAEYINNIKWYLKIRFDLQADIMNNINTIKDYHTVLIFIQKINMTIPITGKRRVFLLNTEQTTIAKNVNDIVYAVKKYNVNIIDYSLVNIKILKAKLPNTTFIHFPFPFRPKESIPKDIPVISLGTPNSLHRKNVIQSLKIPVYNFYNLWGQERDKQICRSKILVNLHYNTVDFGVFESIRCYNAMEYRTLIVSETGVHDECDLLADYIIFAPHTELREKVKDVLDNYEMYYNKMFCKERVEEIETRFSDCYRKSLDIIFNCECNY